jgi:hypothetical protein
MGIVNDRGNGAECAHIALLSLEDAHGSQHPSRYRCSAGLLGWTSLITGSRLVGWMTLLGCSVLPDMTLLIGLNGQDAGHDPLRF